jgi:hypothetical protein
MERQEQVEALAAKIAAAHAPKEPEVKEPAAVAATPAEPAPQEPQAPAAVVDDHEEEHEDSADSDGGDATAPRKNKGVGKRINELTREKHEERRAREQAVAEAAYWREQAQAQQRPTPQAQAPRSGRPTLEDFAYDTSAYEEARDAWLIQEARRSWSEEQKQTETLRQQQERARKFQERVATFEREIPGGWQEVLNAPVPPMPVALEVIADSEIGPKLAHYLATHLDEAFAISQQAPWAQAAALGRIEAALLRPTTPPVPPRNTTTRAPAPAPVVTPTAQSANSPGRMGIEDHIAHVKAQRKAKYG